MPAPHFARWFDRALIFTWLLLIGGAAEKLGGRLGLAIYIIAVIFAGLVFAAFIVGARADDLGADDAADLAGMPSPVKRGEG